MARAIWTGALGFGLVSIPVEVHTAVREHRPHFRMLHAKDRSPISFERVCQKDGKPVAWEDLVRGYEYEKGNFVVLTKEDIASAALEKTKRIDVLDFVDRDAVDDRFFDKPYYLTTRKGGETAYALLREALRESGRIGVAKFILREAQHLCAIEVIDQALVLSTLRFADELVETGSLSFPKSQKFRKQDLVMAKMLVKSLEAEWQPDKYTDDYRDNLMRVIKAKMKGKEPDLVWQEPERDSNVIDLMERLRRSLDAPRGGAKAKRATSAAKKAVATSAKKTVTKRKARKPRRAAA